MNNIAIGNASSMYTHLISCMREEILKDDEPQSRELESNSDALSSENVPIFSALPLASSCSKIVDVKPVDDLFCYFTNNDEIKKECLKQLDKIEQFSNEVLKRHTIAVGTGKMQVVINADINGKSRNNAYWIKGGVRGNVEGYVAVAPTDRRRHKTHFATCPDILSHEFGHSIVSYSSDYHYKFQGGALHESFADIFAIMVKHFHAKTHAESPVADWKIRSVSRVGDEYDIDAIMDRLNFDTMVLRSFNHLDYADRTDSYHMRNYNFSLVNTLGDDYGGVHKHSLIPSNAFYRVATQLGGPCYQAAGNIWVNSVLNGTPDENFESFAKRTLSSTIELSYGRRVQEVVAKAWYDVGVDLRFPILNQSETKKVIDQVASGVVFPDTAKRIQESKLKQFRIQEDGSEKSSSYPKPREEVVDQQAISLQLNKFRIIQ